MTQSLARETQSEVMQLGGSTTRLLHTNIPNANMLWVCRHKHTRSLYHIFWHICRTLLPRKIGATHRNAENWEARGTIWGVCMCVDKRKVCVRQRGAWSRVTCSDKQSISWKFRSRLDQAMNVCVCECMWALKTQWNTARQNSTNSPYDFIKVLCFSGDYKISMCVFCIVIQP